MHSHSSSSLFHPAPLPPYSRASSASPTETSLRTPPLSPSSTPVLLEQPHLSKKGASMANHPPASPTGTIRRPTSRRTTDLRTEGEAGSSSGLGIEVSASRRVSDDDGLIMRERGDRDEGSIGRAGGVDVHPGATRPKRRLSSLPSLPHPYHSGLDYRTISHSSPPQSPSGYSHSNPSYQVLANGTGMSSQQSYAYAGRVTEKGDKVAGREAKDGGSPRLFGIELKWISLLTLALQNAFLTIIMHYSRITASPNKTYSAASAVLLNELLKGSISVTIALRNIDKSMSSPSFPSEKERQPIRQSVLSSRFSMLHPSRLSALRQALFSRDCIQLSIPAILYVIQNNLQYTAASNLDVATFQVTYQMKILTTAAFSVLLLRKRLSKVKWLALFLLAIGVGIVQIQSTAAPAAQGAVTAIHTMSRMKGFLAVTAACMTSGLAGVYFELLIKPTPPTSGTVPVQPDLWIRNTQLSLFSLIPAVLPILFNGNSDGLDPISRLLAAFSNFNGWAIGTVLTQTFGGLVTAIVIRYSDNIMKGFATSLSIVISFLASVALFNYPITFAFVLGSSVVLAATCLYNMPTPPTPITRREMANPPGSPILTSAPIIGEPTPEKLSRTSSVISLLGFGPSRSPSRAPSRTPSGENLKGMVLGGLSSLNPSSYGHQHVYAASAPGTPYYSPSPINGYMGQIPNPYEASIVQTCPPPRSRGSPFQPPAGYTHTLGGLGLSGRKGSQSGESSCSSLTGSSAGS